MENGKIDLSDELSSGLLRRRDRASVLMFLEPGLKERLKLKHEKNKAHRAWCEFILFVLVICIKISVIG